MSDKTVIKMLEATMMQKTCNTTPWTARMTMTGTNNNVMRSQVTSKRATILIVVPEKIKTRSSRDKVAEAGYMVSLGMPEKPIVASALVSNMWTYLLEVLIDSHTYSLHQRLNDSQFGTNGALKGTKVLFEQEASFLTANASRSFNPIYETGPVPRRSSRQL